MANVSSSNGLEKYPKLRFKGFSEPWIKTPFSKLYRYVSEKNDGSMGVDKIISVANMYFKPDARISDEEYLRTYNVFRLGDIAFEGNKSKNFAFGRFVENTIGDGIVSHVFVVFRPLQPDHNLGYWKYAINNENVMGRILARCTKKTTMMTNLVSDDFLEEEMFCPSNAEQMRISSFLELLERKINTQTSLVEYLKKYKRGAIEAIFNRTISFSSNTEDSWKEFRLGEFARRITRKNGQTTDIPLTISAQYGLIDQREFFSKTVASSDMSGYYLLHKGEFAYNRSTSSEYPFGSIKRLDKYDKGAVSTLYLCFDANEEIMDSDFIMWYFESSRWHNGVREICAEGARNHGLLNVPTAGFFDTVHYLPSNKAEQKRIVAFLSTIDERYTRAFSELEELNNLKNGLYQRLFI